MWGLVMVLIPFVPGLLIGFWLATFMKKEKKWAILCFIPTVVLVTPMYMLFVILTSFVKLFTFF